MKKVMILAVILMLAGCVTIVQPTAAPVPTEMPTAAPTIVPTIMPTPTIVPTPTEAFVVTDEHTSFEDKFVEIWNIVLQGDFSELDGIKLVAAKFLEGTDGKLWFAIGFTGSESIEQDAYLMGAVTAIMTKIVQGGYNELEVSPAGIMLIFYENIYSTPPVTRCGAESDWSDMIDFIDGKIPEEDLITIWYYPILPNMGEQGAL